MKNALAIAIVGFTVSLTAGDLTGTVTLKGTPPAEKDITPLKEDATCGKLHDSMPKTAHYVVGAKGELANCVVIIKGVPGAKPNLAAAKPLILDQKGCLYVPQIFAVQVGQKITIKNSDPVMHNVHTSPTATGATEYNQAQMSGGPDLSITLDKPESFLKFKCDVHPWMFAYGTVVDHPYFAVTDKDGKFTIANVPPGKYTVEVAHRKAGTATQEVEIKADGGKAAFTLEAK